MVDVVAAQAAHQLTEQMQLFDGGVSRSQRADGAGAVLGLHRLEAIGHVFQRHAPVDLPAGTTLL